MPEREAAAVNEPAPRPEWPPPPRPLTLRGALLVLGWLVLAVAIALAGLYAWRSHRQQVRAFWGPDTITALEWGERVELRFLEPPAARSEAPGEARQVIDLSDAPNLAHLRQALLDDRHYRWDESWENIPQEHPSAEAAEWVELTFSDVPREQAPRGRILIDLQSGWTGPPGLDRRARLTERVRKALRHYLTTVADAQRRSAVLRAAD